jgi:hypothetical protein
MLSENSSNVISEPLWYNLRSLYKQFFFFNEGNESAVDLEGNGSAEGEMEGEVEVKVSDDTSQSKDEEG